VVQQRRHMVCVQGNSFFEFPTDMRTRQLMASSFHARKFRFIENTRSLLTGHILRMRLSMLIQCLFGSVWESTASWKLRTIPRSTPTVFLTSRWLMNRSGCDKAVRIECRSTRPRKEDVHIKNKSARELRQNYLSIMFVVRGS